MPKVEVIRVIKRVKVRPRPNRGPDANPRKPLSAANRETFAQLVAKGVKLTDAYRQAGYEGGEATRRKLRASPDIDARIMHLLERQIEDDAKARHKREAPIQDRKSRILLQLERLAFSDLRDVVQWSQVPTFDKEGNPTGQKPKLSLTPSHLLTADQAASIKRVFTKAGELNIEWQDQLGALEKLAKIEGMFADGPTSITNNQTLNQVNIGGDNALEAVKRLAFAIQKAQHSQQLTIDATASHAKPEHSQE